MKTFLTGCLVASCSRHQNEHKVENTERIPTLDFLIYVLSFDLLCSTSSALYVVQLVDQLGAECSSHC